ncbi:MAG: ABC transporter permease [Thermomicrobiales bacterium]|nr:ABC transporter permease [Thermomicrobiales bacterium]
MTMAEHLHGVHRASGESARPERPARTWSLQFSPGMWIGLSLAILLLLFAAFGPLLVDADPEAQQLSARLTEPAFLDGGTWEHPFGTDQLGRDLFVRMAIGLRFSLAIGLAVTLIAGLTGVLLGLLAATSGPVVDRLTGFLVNVQIAVPAVILAIAAAAIFQPGTGVVIGVLAATGWVSYQRVVRATTKSLLASPFVEASRSMGGSRVWIARKHLLPNALGPVIVIATQQIAAVMLFEAALSYLGLGVPSHTITLGGMVAQGRESMLAAWWVPALPGVAIAISVLSLNLIGDGLRRRLDPRSRPTRS